MATPYPFLRTRALVPQDALLPTLGEAPELPEHPPPQAAALTDGELVKHALDGRTPAFVALFGRYLGHVHRVISNRLRNPEDVQDVLQDTQLTAWRALARYDASRPFEAWLTCIAVNKCRDWARRNTVRTRLTLHAREHARLWRAELNAPAADKLLIEEETAHRLQIGLERLPAPLREPLLLTAVLDLSHAEAGRTLGLTPKAIENRVRRARAALAQKMKALADAD